MTTIMISVMSEGIPVDKMLEGEREKLLLMEEALGRRVVGQEDAVGDHQRAPSVTMRSIRAMHLKERGGEQVVICHLAPDAVDLDPVAHGKSAAAGAHEKAAEAHQ